MVFISVLVPARQSRAAVPRQPRLATVTRSRCSRPRCHQSQRALPATSGGRPSGLKNVDGTIVDRPDVREAAAPRAITVEA